MIDKLQNPLAFGGRLLLAALFLPAGLGKLTGFAGTVGYISSVGLPMPQVAAAVALVVEIAGALALIASFRTRVLQAIDIQRNASGNLRELLLTNEEYLAIRSEYRDKRAVFKR